MTLTSWNVMELTDAEKKALPGPAIGSGFDVDSRLFAAWGDGSVFDDAHLTARDMTEMLRRDGNAKKLEQVLTLPLRGADYEIVGKGGAAKFVRDTLGPMVDQLIEQATSAVVYRRAFFEKVWTVDAGRMVYDRVAFRPPGSCEAAFETHTARPDGFRQRVSMWAEQSTPAAARGGQAPGYVRVPAVKSWVYTHGQHREPVHGISDLDVCLWAYETRQKLLFLWFQYLENQSLPKMVAYGDSGPQAQANAEALAGARSSGVLPVERSGDPQARAFDLIESSGKGADQFQAAISYLEQQQTNSVLAGFTDLASAAANGRGSNGLSADQSEFFLGSRQAVADEIARSITTEIIRPLVVLNFGTTVEVPHLTIGPIGNAQTNRALSLLQELLIAPAVQAPPEFVDMLLTRTASFIGLDVNTLHDHVEQWRQKQNQPHSVPGFPGTDPAAVDQTALAHVVALAHQLVQAAQAGADPADVLALNARPGSAGNVYRHGWIKIGMSPITDHHRARLAEIGIKPPPAWTDVQVADDLNSDLLVHGKDSKGRGQSIYSAAHTERQAAAKFARIEQLHQHIDRLDAAITRDAPHDDQAASLMLIRRMGLRPGSDADTGAEKKAFGATNLQAQHVTIDGHDVRLTFTGKKGVALDLATTDPELAAILRSRLNGKSGEDRLFDTNERRTGDYLHETLPGFKVKDLRTYRGTVEARRAVAAMPVPTTKREFDAARRKVGEQVSTVLGNTPSVALESYVNPAVFSAWRSAL